MGLYFPLQSIQGKEFPAPCKYQFPLCWSVGHRMGWPRLSHAFCSPGRVLILTWRPAVTPPHPPHTSSSPGSAVGAGPTLANSHPAVKLPAMRTAGFKEKCKMPFQTKHTRSSQQRQQQCSGGSWSWQWGSLDAADGLAVPGRAGRSYPLRGAVEAADS